MKPALKADWIFPAALPNQSAYPDMPDVTEIVPVVLVSKICRVEGAAMELEIVIAWPLAGCILPELRKFNWQAKV